MDTSLIRRIHALRQMTVAELRREWERLHEEPPRSRNRDFLFRRLAWRIQELAHGGLSDAARAQLAELAPDGLAHARRPVTGNVALQEGPAAAAPPRARRDPRLPTPGTVLVREYKGRQLRLTVLDDGFELDGTCHGSLSEAARAVTGSRWNGPLFWGLSKRKRV
jgi:hypothetical protein